MKKISLLILGAVLLLSLSLVSAATQQELTEAKNLIDSKADCKSLSDSQLELIGEYDMEQMHPGQSHEAMHAMMGFKEGDSQEQQFHIKLARAEYCGEENVFGPEGMMGGGMMDMMGGQNMQSNMMGNLRGMGYWNFINIVYVVLLLGVTVLVYLGIYKLWRWEPKHKKDSDHNNGGKTQAK
ncbi:MAG: hypothetical protein HYT16_01665 [DPANN group archaeon]|nr:hypothetical protein [DPANN group archaeon]